MRPNNLFFYFFVFLIGSYKVVMDTCLQISINYFIESSPERDFFEQINPSKSKNSTLSLPSVGSTKKLSTK